MAQVLNGKLSYVITGGTGGLGLLFASWMVHSGTQNVILLGRSGRLAKAADLQFLACSDAQIVVLRSDLSLGEESAAAALFTSSTKRLAGVIHAAGVQVRGSQCWKISAESISWDQQL